MSRERDLTQGNITESLIKLALPIMGTSFINMLYNLTDIMWLGRLSTNAVSAAGTAGFFTWFGAGIIMISQIGVGIGVAQSRGRGDREEMKKYISNAFKLDIFLAILYSMILFFFNSTLIGFFNLKELEVINMAESYLQIIGIGLLFHFLNPMISAIFNAVGNSLTPFLINTIGLFANIILDPLLIFGYGPFPKLGIEGAAIATSLAQLTVTILFFIAMKKEKGLFGGVKVFSKPDMKYIKEIAKNGMPGFVQTSLHSMINMGIAKIVASWGSTAIAAQSTGSQIESLSWMTAEGFSSAITAFIGQNYGAGDYDRVKEGYRKGMNIIGTIGIMVSILFIFWAEPIFSIFIPNDPIAIERGASYLRILGFSQFFICIEIASMGAFNGIGMPNPPAIIAVVFNGLRIPSALILSKTALGLDGIWWSISGSSIFKGIISTALCIYVLKTQIGVNMEEKRA